MRLSYSIHEPDTCLKLDLAPKLKKYRKYRGYRNNQEYYRDYGNKRTNFDNVNKQDSIGSILSQINKKPEYNNIQNKITEHRGIKDGYWQLLQDWSQCSVKCGGGTSTQQWLCVPPKQGGKACLGDSIRTKPCNNQQCPSITRNSGFNLATTNFNIVLKPIITTVQLDKKQLDYINCRIKKEKEKIKSNSFSQMHLSFTPIY